MKKLILAFICLLLAVPSRARTITVDANGPADFATLANEWLIEGTR